MAKQFIFAFTLLATLVVFSYSILRYYRFFRLTRRGFPVRNIGNRLMITLRVVFGQSKILRFPFSGFLHAIVFWGFCVILFGSLEMAIDGLFSTEKSLSSAGFLYDIITAGSDLFALLIALAVIIFILRRLFPYVKRFTGNEMRSDSHIDANIALILILLLMVTLLGMNTAYILDRQLSQVMQEAINQGNPDHPAGYIKGVYPVSLFLAGVIGLNSDPLVVDMVYESCWWSHILLIFVFANMLPYSKHFHVFMSVPNVFLSRLGPLGKMNNMDDITREVRLMLDPANQDYLPVTVTNERFGVKDAEDVCWKNYLDSLACTECGRCTSVCPASMTGKKLSPRKIMMDLRARMKEKGAKITRREGNSSDGRSLVRDYISAEELWACTTCNACARECPVNIHHPELIMEMRRYLVLEEGSAPGELKSVFSCIENNGAPWQFSAEDRMLWAKDLTMNLK